MQIERKEEKFYVKLPGNVYAEEVVYKCFYWYGKDFSVTITTDDPDSFMVVLEPKGHTLNEEAWQRIIEKVGQDLIDFKLRAIVNAETKTIRELIVAKAFANYETEEVPSSEVSDPVGFHPEINKLYE